LRDLAAGAVPRPDRRYGFLWSTEARQGRTKGPKDRLCVIVLAVQKETDQRFRVRFVPITHAPHDPDRALGLLPKVKRHLGLDDDASWYVLDEGNELVWPGADLRPIARIKPGVWSYGVLPCELFDESKSRLGCVLNQPRE